MITRSGYRGEGPPIVGIEALLLARPSRLATSFKAFLSRLKMEPRPIAIIDVALNCARLGLPADWRPRPISGRPCEVLYDPVVDRLDTMSGPQIQRWAEGDIGRLTLGAAVKKFHPAWIQHSRDGWIAKEIKAGGAPPDLSPIPRPGQKRGA